jgi:hypothetical protein
MKEFAVQGLTYMRGGLWVGIGIIFGGMVHAESSVGAHERRYATKNMLTVAQNETVPVGTILPASEGVPVVVTEQKPQSESVPTESESVPVQSTGDLQPLLVEMQAEIPAAAPIPAATTTAAVPSIATPPTVPAEVVSASEAKPEEKIAGALTSPETTTPTPIAVSEAKTEEITVGEPTPTETAMPAAAPETATPALTAEIAPAAQAPETPAQEPMPVKKNNGNGKKRTNSDLIGIDTIDIDEPEGNWLYKRRYWEEAEYRYEKVKALLDKIMDLRMDFINRHIAADREIFDPFYLEIGIKGGKIEETVTDLIAYMDKERETQGSLDEQERDFLAKIQQERETLEQLRQELQGIKKIDDAMDNAIIVLMNMIDQARGFERQSWQNFKAIARELSDKKAHNLYYGIETYWQNVKEIHVYVSTQLSNYFQQLINKAQEQIAKVRIAMDGLKDRGVDLKAHAQKMEQEELERAQAAEHVAVQKPPVKVGIFRRILQAIGSFFGMVWDYSSKAVKTVWQSGKNFVVGLFGKKPTGEPTVVPSVPAAPGQPTETTGQPQENPAATGTSAPIMPTQATEQGTGQEGTPVQSPTAFSSEPEEGSAVRA